MSNEKFRVVAVDDDKDILDLVQLTLGNEYDVFTIQDPQTALNALEFLEPDVMIIDVMMPKITGYQIVEALKSDAKHQSVQIIFLSAKDSILDVKYGYKLGANFYLTKPFQPERVHRTLEMLLHQSGAGKPRHKTLSVKDIQLRFQMGVPTQMGAADAPASSGSPASSFRLKRPLGQDVSESEHKKWVG